MSSNYFYRGASGDYLQLPFGKKFCVTSRDINAFHDVISRAVSSLKSFESLNRGGSFYHSSAHVRLRDLDIVASTSSPFQYDVRDSNDLYFILPLRGEASCIIDKRKYISSPEHGAMLITGEARTGVTGDLSMVQASLDRNRLLNTAATMFGPGVAKQLGVERISHPSIVEFHRNSVRLDLIFEGLCKLIDATGPDLQSLSLMALDDSFYRAIICALLPQEEFERDVPLGAATLKAVDLACEYIDANLVEPIYLTELEHISSLSARALQYAFKRRFGCTPMFWVRQRRLALARQRLLTMNPSDTITNVALACGFSSSSDFTRLYKSNYGETPRDTLRKAN